jgi:hypothetical protein
MSAHSEHPVAQTRPVTDLHKCPGCTRPFVVPRAVLMLADRQRYVVELACSNCEWWAVRIHDEIALEALDDALDRSTAQMHAAVEEAELAEELERIDNFVAALQEDLILPEDF